MPTRTRPAPDPADRRLFLRTSRQWPGGRGDELRNVGAWMLFAQWHQARRCAADGCTPCRVAAERYERELQRREKTGGTAVAPPAAIGAPART